MKIHIHSEQFDGQLHAWCGRGKIVVTEAEFEATERRLRCAFCDSYWFPAGQPEWHFEQAKEALKETAP